MTKFRIETQTVQWNIETLNTLRNAKIALDLCISDYFNLPSSCFFPHAIREQVKEILKKKMLIKDSTIDWKASWKNGCLAKILSALEMASIMLLSKILRGKPKQGKVKSQKKWTSWQTVNIIL